MSKRAADFVEEWIGENVSRDNLDENGGRQSELEAAAGSEGMIILSAKLRKHFFSMPLFDCR